MNPTPRGPRRLTARQRLDRAMGGDALASLIIDLARLQGWQACHFRPARAGDGWRTPVEGDVGFPDVMLARSPEFYLWECKRMSERATPEQLAWIANLQGSGVAARIVRPSDWPWIETTLTRPRPRS